MPLALTLAKRLMLLLCIFLVCFFIVSVLAFIVPMAAGVTTASMRIVTILQDVLMFALPPIATAVLVTRCPAELLCVDRRISWLPLLVAACTLVVSVPAMNYVIYLNEYLPLPDTVADMLRQLEDQANATVQMLIGPHDIPNLLMSILIVGVMAGVTEELLFRGGLQRLLVTGRINPHAAIWMAAVVFSVMHMQFYGFVPRMLLGAFFGYLLWWTRSLWVPMIIHALNNTLYLVSQYLSYPEAESSALDSMGHGTDLLIVLASVILTAFGITILTKLKVKD